MTEQAPTLEGEAVAQGWQDAFRLRDDLLQPDVYAFERVMQKLGTNASTLLFGGGTVNATHMVQAAIEAGWIAEPESVVGETTISKNGSGPQKEKRYYIGGQGIHEMHAGKVLWYGGEISAAYRAATEVPPN